MNNSTTLTCAECGNVLRPVRASNRRRQRIGGKPLRIDLWVCVSDVHGNTRTDIPFYGYNEVSSER